MQRNTNKTQTIIAGDIVIEIAPPTQTNFSCKDESGEESYSSYDDEIDEEEELDEYYRCCETVEPEHYYFKTNTDSLGCELCKKCVGCIECYCCEECAHCEGCSESSKCSFSKYCSNCAYCTNCKKCSNCIACKNQYKKKYMIENV